MQYLWRVRAASMVIAAVMVVGAQSADLHVWNQSSKASSIPGYVEPTTSISTSTTTPAPPVTTFRPSFLMEQRDSRTFRTASANPYFLMMVGARRQPYDGTIKSRVVVDTVFDEEGPEPLVLGDTYTTVDRLQSARGAPPQLPKPQRHQLGGLHPDEVFYANDDLLITKGGGFHSEAFEEPSQLLDEDDETHETASEVDSGLVLPPSVDQEYNGNIPVILPPPTQTGSNPISYLVGGSSRNTYMFVPYVYPRPYKMIRTVYSRIPYRYRYYSKLSAQQPVRSLAGDTDVNFRHPLPPVNPDAEVFVHPPYPRRHRPLL